MSVVFNPFTGTFDFKGSASGGGGGGTTVESGSVEIDFGATEESSATVTVSAAWVTSASIITATPACIATADHDPDDYAAEGVSAMTGNIIDGVSFDVIASVNDTTWGKYQINYLGV